MQVDIWGRADLERQSTFRTSNSTLSRMSTDSKGKGKEKQLDEAMGDSQWKVLESWEVVLNQLKALPQDVSSPIFFLALSDIDHCPVCCKSIPYAVKYAVDILVFR